MFIQSRLYRGAPGPSCAGRGAFSVGVALEPRSFRGAAGISESTNCEQKIPGGPRPFTAIRKNKPRACCGVLQACYGGEKSPSNGCRRAGFECISDSLEKCS